MERRWTLRRLFRRVGFYLTASAGFMMVMISGFTVFYRYVENLSWLDAFYFTVITTRTIGFGDISPQTMAGKMGTIFNALLPATIFLGASLVILERMFQSLELYWKGRLMKKHRNHTIIVADTALLESIIGECIVDKQDFIVISRDALSDLPPSLHDIISESDFLTGDPTRNPVLKQARIETAQRILIATSDDVTNLFVLVSSKSLNPEIKTIVRVNQKETEEKFKAVGADDLLSTSDILGKLFLQAAIHPVAHHFLVKLHTNREDPFLEESRIPEEHIGKPVRSIYPQAIALFREGRYLYDLELEKFCGGDILIGLRFKFSQE